MECVARSWFYFTLFVVSCRWFGFYTVRIRRRAAGLAQRIKESCETCDAQRKENGDMCSSSHGRKRSYAHAQWRVANLVKV